MQRLRRYLEESWSELKKVSWPTRQQTINLTILVIVGSFLVGIYISFWDLLFGEIVKILVGGA